jgi:hypothetical protein
VHKILSGADCRITVWERVAKALDVSPAYLLFGLQVDTQDVRAGDILTLTADPLVCGNGALQSFSRELQKGFPNHRIVVLIDGAKISAKSP